MTKRKFTDDEVREIRESLVPVRALAEKFGVSFAAIQKIKSRRSYKYVSDDPEQVPEAHLVMRPSRDYLESYPEPWTDTFLPKELRGQVRNRKETWVTDDQVRVIRRTSQTSRGLADKLGVVQPTIVRAKNRRTYTHVSDLEDSTLPYRGQYVRKYALDLLVGLPSGYCPTVVTSPPIFSTSNYSRPYLSRHEAFHQFIQRQLRLIYECIRVAGEKGIVLYHTTRDTLNELLHRYECLEYDRSECDLSEYDRLGSLRSPQVITWEHGIMEPVCGGASNSESYLLVFQRESSTKLQIGKTPWYFEPDSHWLKAKYEPADANSEASFESTPKDGTIFRSWFSRRGWYAFPDELADKCISFGHGRILDPFAGTGAVPFAAIRAGRPWLACDNRLFLFHVFEQRRAKEYFNLSEN